MVSSANKQCWVYETSSSLLQPLHLLYTSSKYRTRPPLIALLAIPPTTIPKTSLYPHPPLQLSASASESSLSSPPRHVSPNHRRSPSTLPTRIGAWRGCRNWTMAANENRTRKATAVKVWGRAWTVGTEPREVVDTGGAGLVARDAGTTAPPTWGARGCRRLAGGSVRWLRVVMGPLGLLPARKDRDFRCPTRLVLLVPLTHPPLMAMATLPRALTLPLLTKVFLSRSLSLSFVEEFSRDKKRTKMGFRKSN